MKESTYPSADRYRRFRQKADRFSNGEVSLTDDAATGDSGFSPARVSTAKIERHRTVTAPSDADSAGSPTKIKPALLSTPSYPQIKGRKTEDSSLQTEQNQPAPKISSRSLGFHFPHAGELEFWRKQLGRLNPRP